MLPVVSKTSPAQAATSRVVVKTKEVGGMGQARVDGNQARSSLRRGMVDGGSPVGPQSHSLSISLTARKRLKCTNIDCRICYTA